MKKILFLVVSLILFASCTVTEYAVTDDIYYSSDGSYTEYYDYYSDALTLYGVPVILVRGVYFYQYYDRHHHMWYRRPVPHTHYHDIVTHRGGGHGIHKVPPHSSHKNLKPHHNNHSGPIHNRAEQKHNPRVNNSHVNHNSHAKTNSSSHPKTNAPYRPMGNRPSSPRVNSGTRSGGTHVPHSSGHVRGGRR